MIGILKGFEPPISHLTKVIPKEYIVTTRITLIFSTREAPIMNFRKYIAGIIIVSFFFIGVGAAVAAWTVKDQCNGAYSGVDGTYKLQKKNDNDWGVSWNSTKTPMVLIWVEKNLSKGDAKVKYLEYCASEEAS